MVSTRENGHDAGVPLFLRVIRVRLVERHCPPGADDTLLIRDLLESKIVRIKPTASVPPGQFKVIDSGPLSIVSTAYLESESE